MEWFKSHWFLITMLVLASVISFLWLYILNRRRIKAKWWECLKAPIIFDSSGDRPPIPIRRSRYAFGTGCPPVFLVYPNSAVFLYACVPNGRTRAHYAAARHARLRINIINEEAYDNGTEN